MEDLPRSQIQNQAHTTEIPRFEALKDVLLEMFPSRRKSSKLQTLGWLQDRGGAGKVHRRRRLYALYV